MKYCDSIRACIRRICLMSICVGIWFPFSVLAQAVDLGESSSVADFQASTVTSSSTTGSVSNVTAAGAALPGDTHKVIDYTAPNCGKTKVVLSNHDGNIPLFCVAFFPNSTQLQPGETFMSYQNRCCPPALAYDPSMSEAKRLGRIWFAARNSISKIIDLTIKSPESMNYSVPISNVSKEDLLDIKIEIGN